jgi:hypothetical protein
MHALTEMFLDPTMLAAWGELDTAVRTGETAFDHVFGTSFFEHLAANPEQSARFNAAMRQGTMLTARQLPDAYDFSRFGTVADIGGGDGTLLASVLRGAPDVRGILFDTRSGLAESAATLTEAGVADRCRAEVGDFFASAPSGAEVYLLKSVIHDWDDNRAATILGHVRGVIPDEGRLLVIEPILLDTVEGSIPPTMYLSDLNMLVNVGGRERTRSDFEHLCRRAGFAITSVTPLPPPSAFSLIEAAPA